MNLNCPRVISRWKPTAQFQMPVGEFLENGRGRRFKRHTNAEFRREAFAAFKIYDLADEPMFGNFVGNHYTDGAFTHPHMDPAPKGYVHARCNWMVKKPKSGGDPVLDGVIVQVEEGDLWLCLASLERHGSTAISGSQRLIQSFGALVSIKSLSHIVEISSIRC